jgi:hypothetical protein
MTMVRSLALALAVAVAALPATANARWYMDHINQETCVPIDDLSMAAVGQWERLYYYGGGRMHTPDDVVAAFRAFGAPMKLEVKQTADLQSHGVVYRLTYPDGSFTLIVMFNDLDACKSIMKSVEP